MTPHRRPTILVVDDDPAILGFVVSILGDQNYDIVTACGGPDALQQVRSSPESFALLITDIDMPGLDGLRLVEMLLGAGDLRHAILISGSFDLPEVSATEARLGRAIPMVMKPFTAEELVTAVRSVFSATTQAEA